MRVMLEIKTQLRCLNNNYNATIRLFKNSWVYFVVSPIKTKTCRPVLKTKKYQMHSFQLRKAIKLVLFINRWITVNKNIFVKFMLDDLFRITVHTSTVHLILIVIQSTAYYRGYGRAHFEKYSIWWISILISFIIKYIYCPVEFKFQSTKKLKIHVETDQHDTHKRCEKATATLTDLMTLRQSERFKETENHGTLSTMLHVELSHWFSTETRYVTYKLPFARGI